MTKPMPNHSPITIPNIVEWASYYQRKGAEVTHPVLKQFYSAGVVNPETPIAETPFVALDFETTGLDDKKDAIVSAGLVPFDLQRIRVRDAKHWIIKPEIELTDSSVTFHHITHAQLRYAPAITNILPELIEALAGKVVVVHFRYIERNFLFRAVMEALGEWLLFPVIDTMALEKKVQQNFFRQMKSLFSATYSTSVRLGDSRMRYGLPRYSSHHALTDAIATAELFTAQMQHQFNPKLSIQSLWC